VIINYKLHIDPTNETYIQYLKFAACIGITMIYGGIQALIHAIYPGILQNRQVAKSKNYTVIINR
jgi:hypothetical protein